MVARRSLGIITSSIPEFPEPGPGEHYPGSAPGTVHATVRHLLSSTLSQETLDFRRHTADMSASSAPYETWIAALYLREP